ncbi:hypothetical protein CSHISOI_11005, partial [Colletotrichum shisoi]
MGDTLPATKLRDHFIFKKADDFFQDEVDGQATSISQPSRRIEDDQYYILQSVVQRSPVSPPETELQLWISRNPFQITAVRVLKSLAPAEARPRPQTCEKEVVEALDLPLNEGIRPAVIWKTKPRGLLYGEHSAVLCLEKSITADYMGFGEQGGKDLFKKKIYMNYFNACSSRHCDNMKYQNVWGQGPLDDSEPLYHSEPYWIEVDAQPGYQTQIGAFIDNYSQICVDIGMKDPTQLRVATRSNSFQGIFVAGDSIHVQRRNSPPFRLLLDSDGRCGDPNSAEKKKKAVEIWSLYSYNLHKDQFQGREGEIPRAVLPTCRYLIRLRYSLMQLLYDAMFENMINGLPIARDMPIPNALDRSLFSSDNRRFTSSQYTERNDLLKKSRKVYLPYHDSWYPLNLRPDDPLGAPLGPAASGGQRIEYDCRISDDERQIPFSTPITTPQNDNPITIHVYPGKEGKENTYDMYLESLTTASPGTARPRPRSSMPTPSDPPQYGEAHHFEGLADAKANDKYTKVQFKHRR